MTPIPYPQGDMPGFWDLLLHDPTILILLLPLAAAGVMLWLRVRAWRRINAMSASSKSMMQESSARTERYWAESAARQQRLHDENIARMERYQAETAERSERMIAILTEMRDLLARPPDR